MLTDGSGVEFIVSAPLHFMSPNVFVTTGNMRLSFGGKNAQMRLSDCLKKKEQKQ